MSNHRQSSRGTAGSGVPPAFAEAPAWSAVGGGWRPLFGSFRDLGFSFEWHEFTSSKDLDWARSFHPGSLELCLNLDGTAEVSNLRDKLELRARQVAFYYQGAPPLSATRRAGAAHRFITVEFARPFLAEHLRNNADQLDGVVSDVVRGKAEESRVSAAEPITASLLQLVESLRHCPVFKPAQEMWFRSKALELVSQLFFKPAGGELLCTRAQRAARERVQRTQTILRAELREPPTLEELGQRVGCSHFYLSRLFSQETGMTIQQYIRQIRLERAAELLRSGKCNVTEAAMEVGYNSLSHFSTAFHEMFGCCPGLYPMHTHTQNPLHGGE